MSPTFRRSTRGIAIILLLISCNALAGLTDGLVGYWSFDENSGGTAQDYSGYNNHGTIHNPLWTTGKSGSALYFNGLNTYVEVADSPSLDITGTITLSAWVKAETYQYFRVGLVTKGGRYHPRHGYDLYLHENGNDMKAGLSLRYSDLSSSLNERWNAVSSNTAINDAQWHQITATYDGSIMKMYVDGNLENELVNSDGFDENDASLMIGLFQYGYNDAHGNKPNIPKGIIDDVRIYNRALSSSEIQQLAGGGGGGGISTIFEENFESYSLNTWPSSNWTGFGGNDSDHSANKITTDPTDPSNQVFRLYGRVGSFWGAGANRPFAVPDDFTVSLKVYNGGENVPSYGHQARACLSTRSNIHWTTPGRGYFHFNKNGYLYACEGSILQSYSTNRWYDMTVAFSRSQTDLTLHYWVDGVDRGSFSTPVIPERDNIQSRLELTCNVGSAYFDDIKVYTGSGSDPDIERFNICSAENECLMNIASALPYVGQIAGLVNLACDIKDVEDEEAKNKMGIFLVLKILDEVEEFAPIQIIDYIKVVLSCLNDKLWWAKDSCLAGVELNEKCLWKGLEFVTGGLPGEITDRIIGVFTGSPVDIRIIDSQGNVMEPNPQGYTDNGLDSPGWIFMGPDHKELALVFDANDVYLIEIVGLPEAGSGSSFDLQLFHQLPDGSQTVYTYLNVPTSETGIATAVIGDEIDPILEVDIDGDGVVDLNISQDPPTANAGGPYVIQATNWSGASVELDGTDSIDADGNPLAYQWDLDLAFDSDGDGDPNYDIDSTEPIVNSDFPIGQTEISFVVNNEYGLISEPDITTVTVSFVEVNIDIKPDSLTNSINLGSNGVIPVAFLTDSDFDASTIDPATITLRGQDFSDGIVKLRGKKDAPKPMANLEDVDGDGDLDLMVHLETENLSGLGLNAVCELGALTYDGYVVSGSDTIHVVPKE